MPIVPFSDARWFLTALDGPRAGTVWPIAGTVTIGRAGDIRVDDRRISREHVRVRAAESVRARATGRSKALRGRLVPTPIPQRRWTRLFAGETLTVGTRFRITRRPRRRSKTPAIILGAVLLAVLLVPFLATGPAWRWALLLAPMLLIGHALRRRQKRLRPLRDPLAILVSSHEGRSFHREPHVPLRALRGDLAGSGWAVRSEAVAIWLAGYLAVWNDPDVLRVTSPWVTTHGNGIEIVFSAAAPNRDSTAITWGAAPQWALPLRVRGRWRATAEWAAQLHLPGDSLPESYGFAEAMTVNCQNGLGVPLAHDGTQPVIIDLERTPHALVAGTTGSGKSELLTSWLLLLAARIPPRELTMVLLDFKGGATSATLSGLPHVIDHATDLETAGAQRIVISLRAALRRRESLLAQHGAREIAELADPPARMIVVVDEFRALSDDIPETLDQLVRLAAQGRSLGVHLILATQRPGGAVSADMRANIPLRIALRTTESVDSHDVIGTDEAADLPPIPGRAIISDGARRHAQIAWAAEPRAVVAQIRQHWGESAPPPPWLPDLPHRITLGEANGGIAVIDRPDALSQQPFQLPARHLFISAAHGSGLTTAAQTCAAAAWAKGEHVWLVGTAACEDFGPGFGGRIDPAQTRLVAQVFDHAARSRGRIVVDDVEAWARVHEQLHGPGSADRALDSLLRSEARTVLLSREISPRWGRDLSDRIYLAGRDRAGAALTGLTGPAQHVVASSVPGRAVIGGEHAQIAVPVICGLTPPPPRRVRRFVPLPDAAAPRVVAGTVCLGHDGDGEVRIPARSIAVVGPRGSGRAAAAQMIAAQVPGAVICESPSTSMPVPDGNTIAIASPEIWQSSFSGVLASLRAHSPVLVLRPDLCPRVMPGIESELEPGSAGYGILVDGSRARALRIARHASASAHRS